MEDLYVTLIALLPSIGTVVAFLVMVFKVVRQFKDLKDEVKNEGTITRIDKDNLSLKKLVCETYTDTLKALKESNTKLQELLTKEETVNALLKQLKAQQAQIDALTTDIGVLLNEQANEKV